MPVVTPFFFPSPPLAENIQTSKPHEFNIDNLIS